MVSITFQTTPSGAQIFLDSADTGKITPVILDIAEGTHTYMLRLTRYEDIYGQFTVIAGNSYILEVTMKETITAMQQAFNKSMIKIGWASFVVGSLSLIVGMFRRQRGF